VTAVSQRKPKAQNSGKFFSWRNVCSVGLVILAVGATLGQLGPKLGYSQLSPLLIGFFCLLGVFAVRGQIPGISVSSEKSPAHKNPTIDSPPVDDLQSVRTVTGKPDADGSHLRLVSSKNLPSNKELAARMIRQTSDFRENESGAATIFSMSMLALVFVFAGLVWDKSNAERIETSLKSGTDTAAYAALFYLPNAEAVTTSFYDSQFQTPATKDSKIVISRQIEIGVWQDGVFAAAVEHPNAIRVTALRERKNSRIVPVVFLRLLGVKSWRIRSQSVAFRDAEKIDAANPQRAYRIVQ